MRGRKREREDRQNRSLGVKVFLKKAQECVSKGDAKKQISEIL